MASYSFITVTNCTVKTLMWAHHSAAPQSPETCRDHQLKCVRYVRCVISSVISERKTGFRTWEESSGPNVSNKTKKMSADQQCQGLDWTKQQSDDFFSLFSLTSNYGFNSANSPNTVRQDPTRPDRTQQDPTLISTTATTQFSSLVRCPRVFILQQQ